MNDPEADATIRMKKLASFFGRGDERPPKRLTISLRARQILRGTHTVAINEII